MAADADCGIGIGAEMAGPLEAEERVVVAAAPEAAVATVEGGNVVEEWPPAAAPEAAVATAEGGKGAEETTPTPAPEAAVAVVAAGKLAGGAFAEAKVADADNGVFGGTEVDGGGGGPGATPPGPRATGRRRRRSPCCSRSPAPSVGAERPAPRPRQSPPGPLQAVVPVAAPIITNRSQWLSGSP